MGIGMTRDIIVYTGIPCMTSQQIIYGLGVIQKVEDCLHISAHKSNNHK